MTNDNWISVKDRLPEDDIFVLWITEAGSMFVREIDKDDEPWWNEVWAYGGTVTHWQPLPEPPKEEV